MKNIIPGHMLGVTWALALMLAAVTYWATGRPEAVIGSLVLTLGFFLADQATHLAQEAHSTPPPTWLERMQQKHRYTFVISGLLLVGVGGFLMV